MSEGFANNAMHERATMQAAERAEWERVLGPVTKAKKLAPAKRAVQVKQEKKSIFQRFFGV